VGDTLWGALRDRGQGFSEWVVEDLSESVALILASPKVALLDWFKLK
jgi:hypothetical protein